MAATATIRVPIETRDRLDRLAKRRGASVAELIGELALREEVFRSHADERRAWSNALGEQRLTEDLELWDETVGDGLC